MKQSYFWNQKGRESLTLDLEIDSENIISSHFKAIGGLSFLRFSNEMNQQLSGPIENLKIPEGTDPHHLIWKEMILRIKNKWQLPVTHEEICHCRKISTEKVDRAIVYGCQTLETLRKRTSVNTGCGTCKEDVEKLIEYRLKK